MGEHDRALGLDRLAEHDAGSAVDEPRKPVAPLLERALPKVLAVEAQEIEGDEAGARAAGLGAQRPEVAPSIGTEHDRLAVDQRVLGGQIADRLRDPRQPVGEIRAVAGPQRDAGSRLAGEQPVAVVFDLVQPGGVRGALDAD
jgi:hypothetical protein